MSELKNIRDIPIGTKMELAVIDPIEGKLNIEFVSQIEGCIDENFISIAAPIFEAKVYPVKVHSRIEAYLYCNSNQVYRITGYVESRQVVDDIALLDVRVTDKIQKIQRRQFFRFVCSVPIIFYMQQPDQPEEEIRKFLGRTIDLSGGGLSALVTEAVSQDTELGGRLKLDDDNSIDFVGKVIRCNKNIINDEIKYILSISFVDIDYKKREKIITFIFNQQRILLKKELR